LLALFLFSFLRARIREIRPWARRRALRLMESRDPDLIIGGSENPYLYRWRLFPRNRWLNIYLHRFLRSDIDEALHDHPEHNVSWILEGGYTEWTPYWWKNGGFLNEWPKNIYLKATRRSAGDIIFRVADKPHRIELIKLGKGEAELPCLTIWIIGPKIREWGFHCPNGWMPWKKFDRQGGCAE
jgi:hypothetical protein